MPLSEQEQRLLEEMERSLYHNDADFVATVSGRGGRRNYTTIVVGILVGILGIAAIVTGVAIRLPIIGIAGFVVMFVGVLVAISAPRLHGGEASADDAPGMPSSRAPKPDFMQRMNDRWEKRQDNRDQ
ncbi:MAG TPA: DUF3040 domain-containing protein [Lacisediminihabitans sp.]|jgi:hypothetical protein|nr:DUF3040 domain-containing protein [Lacisediminihabitans sp.]HXD62829.1 DUF3040 domain-containing protein [Lacisediminihabitans sp.]